jgi:hypothetical protein
MKGVVYTKVVPSVVQEAFDQAIKLAGGGFRTDFLYEHITLANVNNKPPGSTPLHRGPAGNILLLSAWDEDTPENLQTLRTGIRKLAAILENASTSLTAADTMGYSNHGMSVSERYSLRVVHADIFWLQTRTLVIPEQPKSSLVKPIQGFKSSKEIMTQTVCFQSGSRSLLQRFRLLEV